MKGNTMTIRTPEDVKGNFESRRNLVKSIVLNQGLVETYRTNDNASLLNTVADRLAEAYFHLYEENKEYDEYLNRNYITLIPEKKTFWQKLLRK